MKAKQECDRLFAKGDSKSAFKILPRAIDISQEMAKQLIDKLIENDIDYIVAPYEADAQMAYLVRNGLAHYAISEDSDLILYGCHYVLYKLDKDGNGVLLRHSKVLNSLGDDVKSFDFLKFKRMCILSGCDYLASLTGVGLATAKKFFLENKNENMEEALLKIPKILNKKKLVVPKEYVKKFIEAENVFDHQLIYCPREKKLKPFTDYGENTDKDELEYAGSYFDEQLALNFVFGNVDFQSMQIIDSDAMQKLEQKYINSPKSIWCPDYKLAEPDRFEAIWQSLVPSFEKPEELNGKRKFEKIETDVNGFGGFVIKGKRRKAVQNGGRRVTEDDEVIVEASFRSSNGANGSTMSASFRSETSIRSVHSASQEESSGLEVEVKSRFFSQNGDSDLQRIQQNKQAIRDKLSKLYIKPSASQKSTDSGFESQPLNSQELTE